MLIPSHVTNGGVLDVNVGRFDTGSIQLIKLELTAIPADHNGNVVSGVFNIHSSDYGVLNALTAVNVRTGGYTLRLTMVTGISR